MSENSHRFGVSKQSSTSKNRNTHMFAPPEKLGHADTVQTAERLSCGTGSGLVLCGPDSRMRMVGRQLTAALFITAKQKPARSNCSQRQQFPLLTLFTQRSDKGSRGFLPWTETELNEGPSASDLN